MILQAFIFCLNILCQYKFLLLSPTDSHRQRIVNWIDGTGQLSTAFDFTTKGILQVNSNKYDTENFICPTKQENTCSFIPSSR